LVAATAVGLTVLVSFFAFTAVACASPVIQPTPCTASLAQHSILVRVESRSNVTVTHASVQSPSVPQTLVL